jgi:hypothetical protein
MRRALAAVLACIALSAGACKREGAAPAAAPVPPATKPVPMAFHEGDVIAEKASKVTVFKLLKIESLPGGNLTFHILSYKESFATVDEAKHAYEQKKLTVFIWHAPVDGLGVDPATNIVLANQPVTDKELQGYRTYVEMTGGRN